VLNDVKRGDAVQISKPDGTAQDQYTVRMEAVENPETVLLHAPKIEGRTVKLPTKQSYKLCFLLDGSMLLYDASLRENLNLGGYDMMRFLLTNEGEKVQRRNAFRFACTLPFTFNKVHDDGEQSPLTEGVIRDLSGGGIKFVTTLKIEMGALLRIDLNLDDDYVMAFGLVVMHRHIPDNVKYPHTYGIRFEVMSVSDEERIVRFIYSEQRKLLKRPQQTLYKVGKK